MRLPDFKKMTAPGHKRAGKSLPGPLFRPSSRRNQRKPEKSRPGSPRLPELPCRPNSTEYNGSGRPAWAGLGRAGVLRRLRALRFTLLIGAEGARRVDREASQAERIPAWRRAARVVARASLGPPSMPFAWRRKSSIEGRSVANWRSIARPWLRPRVGPRFVPPLAAPTASPS
jgi:hypothetical protein